MYDQSSVCVFMPRTVHVKNHTHEKIMAFLGTSLGI